MLNITSAGCIGLSPVI